MSKEKWKVALKILAGTEERVWVVQKGKELHKDYLGRVMKFNTREIAEIAAGLLNKGEKDER